MSGALTDREENQNANLRQWGLEWAADHIDAQADRIAALEAERDKLREALKPFARMASEPAVKNARNRGKNCIHSVILIPDLDTARAAIAETEGE